MKLLITSRRKSYDFDPQRLRASIEHCCLASGLRAADAKQISATVVRRLAGRLRTAPALQSHELRQIVAELINAEDQDAAYLYLHHRKLA